MALAIHYVFFMMTSSNGNIFRVTGHLCEEFTPHKGQWRGALLFSLICVWINRWVSNHEAGDLRRYRSHYDVSVMFNGWFMKLCAIRYWTAFTSMLIKPIKGKVTWNNCLRYFFRKYSYLCITVYSCSKIKYWAESNSTVWEYQLHLVSKLESVNILEHLLLMYGLLACTELHLMRTKPINVMLQRSPLINQANVGTKNMLWIISFKETFRGISDIESLPKTCTGLSIHVNQSIDT